MESSDYSFEIKDVKNKLNLVGHIFMYNRGNEKYKHKKYIHFLNLICQSIPPLLFLGLVFILLFQFNLLIITPFLHHGKFFICLVDGDGVPP